MAPPYSKLMSQLTGSSGVSVVAAGGDGEHGDVTTATAIDSGSSSVSASLGSGGGRSGTSSSTAAGSRKKRRKQLTSSAAAQSPSQSRSRSQSSSMTSSNSTSTSTSSQSKGKGMVRPRLRRQEEELLRQVHGVRQLEAQAQAQAVASACASASASAASLPGSVSTSVATYPAGVRQPAAGSASATSSIPGGDGIGATNHGTGTTTTTSSSSSSVQTQPPSSSSSTAAAPSSSSSEAAMVVSMNPRIMHLQRQIAREAALMATMTSAQHHGHGHGHGQHGQTTTQVQVHHHHQHPHHPQYQQQKQQQQQSQSQPMMPTVGHGIAYNAIGMTGGGLLHHHHHHQQQQQLQQAQQLQQQQQALANHGASSASASSSVASSKSSGGRSSRDGGSKKKRKKDKDNKDKDKDNEKDRDGVPPFFQGKKLRSGVWLQAEIEYAMEIIQDFRRGNLDDCPNGATLRQYLAKRLHCNPMRLSKKLSKAMGNSPESQGAGSNGPGYVHASVRGGGGTTTVVPITNQRRMDLEQAFHGATLDRKAVLASSSNSTANSVCSSKASTPPPAAAKSKSKNDVTGQPVSVVGSGTTTMPMPVNAPPPRQQQPTTAPLNANYTNTAIDLGALVAGQPQVQGLSTMPVSNPFAMPMYQSGQQQQPQPMIPTNGLEGALLQNQASMQVQMASQMRQIQELQESLATAKAELEQKEKAVKEQAELHQSFLKALQSKVSSSTSPESRKPSNKPNRAGNEATTDKDAEKGRSNSTGDYNELLAGFEKVVAPAASGGATDLDATQIPLWSNVDTALSLGMPETPTLTSKSFDDFHRFLGQGIPSMPNLARGDLNAPSGNGSEGGVRPRPIAVATLNGPATEALHGQGGNAYATGDISFSVNASDDYSMLAQQSVLAVMQHSAYATPLEINPPAAGTATGTKRSSRTVSEANSTSSAKRARTAPSPQRSTVSSNSSNSNNGMRANLVSGTESESMFDSSSRGVTSSSGSGSDNDNSNDGTTSNDGSDDAGIDSFGEPNATAKMTRATKATEKKGTMEVSFSTQ